MVPVASSNQAVMSLLERARVHAASGRYSNAEVSLERALRIEPGNAHLWYELAQLAMQQGNFQQAESFALRANSFAAHNPRLKQRIQQLISEAKKHKLGAV